MARGTNGGFSDPVTGGQAEGGAAWSARSEGGTVVAELTYSAAGQELDLIIEEFEAGVIDVDRLVERLERATEIVDELDRRLRRTRMQVEELVPRLERIGRPDPTDTDEDDEAAIIDEIYIEETEVDLELEDELLEDTELENDEKEKESPPGLF
jgi:exonuclease VII small subunit